MAAKPSDNQLKELTQKFLNEGRSEEQIYKMFVKKGWIDRDEELEKKFEQERTPEQEEQTTPEAGPEGETINEVEYDSDNSDAVKQFIDDIDKGYEEAQGDEGNGLKTLNTVYNSLISNATPIISYLMKNPDKAEKIVDSVQNGLKLGGAKTNTFLDNRAGKLLYGSDKSGRGLLGEWLGVQKNGDKWYNWKLNEPFAADSSKVNDVTGKLNLANNQGKITDATIGQTKTNSNAWSQLSKGQKVQGVLQILGMALSALDGASNAKRDNENGINKLSEGDITGNEKFDNILNEAVNKFYTFSDYCDTAVTDVTPFFAIPNIVADIALGDKKDESGLKYARGGLGTKFNQLINNFVMGKDSAAAYWEEPDVEKREENKKTADWMKERGYKANYNPIKRVDKWFTPSTKKGSQAENDKKIAKATKEVQSKEGTDSMGDNAFSSANRQISQINHVSGKKNGGFDIKDLTDKYKWTKVKGEDGEYTYDWINKKTNQPLSKYTESLSKKTKKEIPEFYKKDDESPINI